MSYARSLTCANRIVRLDIVTSDPSDKVVSLGTHVVKVSAPIWFDIKSHPSFKDGGRHLWQLISPFRNFTTELKSIFDLVIKRNSNFQS